VATTSGGGAPFYRAQAVGKRSVHGEESTTGDDRFLNKSVS
jgi:hypothetical protein